MSKVWRFVLFLALALVVAGAVLLGVAWVTGASIPRIVELVFGGQAELEAWFEAVMDRVAALWTAALEQLRSFF